MKMLPTRTAQKAADMGEIPPIIMDEPKDWQAEYNRVFKENIRLKRQLEAVKCPPRTQAEAERDWQAVTAFLDSMPPAAGAVTCAGVYTVAFLQQEERVFVVKLCHELVRRYAAHQTLIQSTFDTWKNHAQ